jgi:O-acetyl-ADP-ribose deacetylase
MDQKSLSPSEILQRVEIARADITTLAVDAIVNAGNQTLLGGGGVDGAIHQAAGPELLDACRVLPELPDGVRCPIGEARITEGFRLRARYVIHTVGPVWRGGGQGEPLQLAAAYRNSLALAVEKGLTTIAFPAISTGAYGYPFDAAADIAVREVTTAIAKWPSLEQVILVAYNAQVAQALVRAMACVEQPDSYAL